RRGCSAYSQKCWSPVLPPRRPGRGSSCENTATPRNNSIDAPSVGSLPEPPRHPNNGSAQDESCAPHPRGQTWFPVEAAYSPNPARQPQNVPPTEVLAVAQGQPHPAASPGPVIHNGVISARLRQGHSCLGQDPRPRAGEGLRKVTGS